jgi:protein Mpv17
MLAQSATAAFLFGAGDVIAQQAIERQGKNHDVSI